MPLTDLRLAGLNQELLRLRGEVVGYRNTVRTLGLGLQGLPVDDRECLRIASQLRVMQASLEPRLTAISAQIPELSRQTHRGESASAFGALGNLRGTLRVAEREVADLERELRALNGRIMARLQDPRRTPGLPAEGLWEAFNTLLELVTLWLERARRAGAQP